MATATRAAVTVTFPACPCFGDDRADTRTRHGRAYCARCGRATFPRTGTFGVFVWRGDGRYSLADALATRGSSANAQRVADGLARSNPDAGGTGGYVVRFVSLEA
jgi:hypothetical protein